MHKSAFTRDAGPNEDEEFLKMKPSGHRSTRDKSSAPKTYRKKLAKALRRSKTMESLFSPGKNVPNYLTNEPFLNYNLEIWQKQDFSNNESWSNVGSKILLPEPEPDNTAREYISENFQILRSNHDRVVDLLE